MTTTQEVQCWRCAHQHQARLFCPICKAIQFLPPQIDYFSVFDLPKHPCIDESLLTQRYYELSRKLHPDLYQTGTSQEQEASLKNTATLNHAYRTLRDAIQRGQYWLELHGEQLGKDNNRVPPKLAALVFDVQEKLSEVRDARTNGNDAEGQAELQQIRVELDQYLTRLQGELDANFARWGGDSVPSDLLSTLKRLLSDIAYLRTLLRDVEKESLSSWNA